MSETFDVVVAGCGIAGLAAATAAHEAGASVLVLERAPREERGGNTRYTEAFLRMKSESEVAHDFEDMFLNNSGWYPDPLLVADTAQDRENWPGLVRAMAMTDAEIIATFAENAGPTLAWLRERGIRFEMAETPFLTTSTSRLTPSGGGLALVETLADRLETAGVEIRYRTAARSLQVDETGAVVGVHIVGPGNRPATIAARAVILACGGFEGSIEMQTRYIGPRAAYLRPIARGGFYNKGEGVQMALDIGAAPAGEFGKFHAEPMDPRSGKAEPAIFAFPYGVLVNKTGARFVDEAPATVDATYERITRQIFEQPDGVAWAVFDAKLADIPNYQKAIRTDQPPIEADNLTGLAQKLGVPEAPFEATIAAYNAACAPGEFRPLEVDGLATADLTPPKSNWARPIDKPPFQAYPIIAANVLTFGGIKVDCDARAVNQDGETIPGLYVAGEPMGIYYDNYVGSTSVLRGAVFGRLAGMHAGRRPNSP